MKEGLGYFNIFLFLPEENDLFALASSPFNALQCLSRPFKAFKKR